MCVISYNDEKYQLNTSIGVVSYTLRKLMGHLNGCCELILTFTCIVLRAYKIIMNSSTMANVGQGYNKGQNIVFDCRY